MTKDFDSQVGDAGKNKKIKAMIAFDLSYNTSRKGNLEINSNIYKIFPATVPLPSVRKMLETACSRKTCKMLFSLIDFILNLLIEMIGFV